MIITLVLGLAAGFFIGMKYQQGQTGTGRGGGQFAQRFGQGQQGLRPVAGQILSVDDTGITVKARDGSSKIVIISSSTSIDKPTQASKSDLKQGDMVAVFGTQNADGSVTAQNVQINPAFRMGGSQPAPTQ